MSMLRPVALIILDGFGYSTERKYNAIAHAHMPHFSAWWKKYPHALLNAAGSYVGLPDSFCGNSEVGHLTIGAGRVTDQILTLWRKSVNDGSFAHNAVILEQYKKLKHVAGVLHIMGLLSDAGVHSHENEIYAVIESAAKSGIKKIVIHPFLDGRDVLPQSAYTYLHRLAEFIKHYNSQACYIIIGSIHGRFYAMDRDNNWDRIEKSYRVLTAVQGNGSYDSWEKVLERNYAHGITDEFIPPTQLSADGIIHNGDGIVFCNIRSDRARQLTQCFVDVNDSIKFTYFILKPLILTFFITPVLYDASLLTSVLFHRTIVANTLKDILALHHKTIFSIAETEKYAHVTYFFRGENEEPVATETRMMIPSIRAEKYSAHPHMSAATITDAVIKSVSLQPCDFYLINYANADMVGHSGDFNATVKAVEFLDIQLQRLYEEIVEKMDGTVFITADHGKAEYMYDDKVGQPYTAHTCNRVPFIMLKKDMQGGLSSLPLNQLADIAPFILRSMGLPKPQEMK